MTSFHRASQGHACCLGDGSCEHELCTCASACHSHCQSSRSTPPPCLLVDDFNQIPALCACMQGLGLSLEEFVWRVCAAWCKALDLTSHTVLSSGTLIRTRVDRPEFIVCRASPRGCRVLSGAVVLPEGGVLLLEGHGAQFHRTRFIGTAPILLRVGIIMRWHVSECMPLQHFTTTCI